MLRAILARATSPAGRARPATGLRDLEAIQRFAAGSGPFAFFDAPWTPFFPFALFLFHSMFGLLAVFAGCVLLLIALLNQVGTAGHQQEARTAAVRSAHFIEQMRAGGETVQGLGMHDAMVARSGALRDTVLEQALTVSHRNGFYGVLSKTLRLFFQSMMLALEIIVRLEADTLVVIIVDDGAPFDPSRAPQTDITVSLEDRPLGGLGLLLVHEMMDAVEYHRVRECNVVTLTKRTA